MTGSAGKPLDQLRDTQGPAGSPHPKKAETGLASLGAGPEALWQGQAQPSSLSGRKSPRPSEGLGSATLELQQTGQAGLEGWWELGAVLGPRVTTSS